MYCKNCNKDYPKKTKLCKKCGIALIPGQAPVEKKGISKKVFVIGGAVAVLIIAAFLLVGLIGMVPSDIKGKWYEVNGFDFEYTFLTYGKIEFSGHGETYTGTYEYDQKMKTGMVYSDSEEVSDREFTYDNATITMDISVFTRQEVEQFDSESAFEEMLDGLKDIEE